MVGISLKVRVLKRESEFFRTKMGAKRACIAPGGIKPVTGTPCTAGKRQCESAWFSTTFVTKEPLDS